MAMLRNSFYSSSTSSTRKLDWNHISFYWRGPLTKTIKLNAKASSALSRTLSMRQKTFLLAFFLSSTVSKSSTANNWGLTSAIKLDRWNSKYPNSKERHTWVRDTYQFSNWLSLRSCSKPATMKTVLSTFFKPSSKSLNTAAVGSSSRS